jgi:outer membrane assembly lipoprotein YfiO
MKPRFWHTLMAYAILLNASMILAEQTATEPVSAVSEQATEQQKIKKSKKEKKSEKLKFPFPGVLLKDMNEEQLEKTIAYAKQAQDQELAFKAYAYLISQSKSQETIKKYKLDFADYAFELQDYEKASMAYEDFGILYPGSAEAEYAQYKAILCAFLTSLDFDRDQSITHKTISLCLLFGPKAKDEKFASESLRIYKICRKRLFDHELYVFETYLKMLKFNSAAKRLEYIEKEFSDVPDHEKYITYCKEMLVLLENRKTRPFYIQLRPENALIDKDKRVKPSTMRHMFFFLA